jgi:hypothetical protein
MNRKLKLVGFAVAAMMLAMAVSASAAFAGDFHSEKTDTTLTGSQIGEDVFTVNAGTVRCTEATYSGTSSTTSTTETTTKLTPKYSGCTAFGFVSTTIDVNGCQYEFSGDNTNVNIVNCSTGIVVTAFNCWVTVKNQNNLNNITYRNSPGEGTSRDYEASFNLNGITYTQASKSFPGCLNGTFTSGTYQAITTVRGTKESKSVGIWRL